MLNFKFQLLLRQDDPQLEAAEAQDVVGAHLRSHVRAQLRLIEQGAVRAADIGDEHALVRNLDDAVLAGDRGILDRHIILVLAAGGIRARVQRGIKVSAYQSRRDDVRTLGAVSPLLDCTLPMSPEGERYQIVQRTLGPGWRSKVRAFSPLFRAKKGGPSVYFIHGQRDPWVPVEHSTKPAEYLQRLHTETRVVIVPTMGHGLSFKDPKQAAAWRAFARWVGAVL